MPKEQSADLMKDLLHDGLARDEVEPPVTPRVQVLPFNALSWENFERLCTRLVASQGDVVDCHRYGVRGDFQAGIDILAHRRTAEGGLERWCYQCKRWQRMTPGDLRQIVGKFRFPADRYVVLISLEASASLRDVVAGLPDVDLWDAEDISSRLKGQPELIEDFFGAHWRTDFCTVGREGVLDMSPLASDLPPTVRIHEVEYVLIEGGRVIIGSDLRPEERPVHEVVLKPYYISRYPITVRDYLLLTDTTNRPVTTEMGRQIHMDGNLDHPIIYVSWFRACEYCKWAGAKLPTEVQWEHACRGKDLRLYPWGNEWKELHCNSAELGLGHTIPVSGFKNAESPYGVIDMLGNVWEWCSTRWGQDWQQCRFTYPYKNDEREDPDSSDWRILRGGSWNEFCGIMRATYRHRRPPSTTVDNIGFRCVYEPDSWR